MSPERGRLLLEQTGSLQGRKLAFLPLNRACCLGCLVVRERIFGILFLPGFFGCQGKDFFGLGFEIRIFEISKASY
jgi:hypothetical protein